MGTQQIFQGPVDSHNIPFGMADLYLRDTATGVYRRVGELVASGVTLETEKKDIEGDFPMSTFESYIIAESAILKGELREFSADNIADVLGTAKTAIAGDAATILAAGYTAGASTLVVTGDKSAVYEEGDVLLIKEASGNVTQQETFVVESFVVAGDTTITLPTDGALRRDYSVLATVEKVAGNKVGAGGAVSDLELEAILVYTRPNGDHMSMKVHKLAVPGSLDITLQSRDETTLPVEWPIKKDSAQPPGEQLFVIRQQLT